ncbi:phenylacetate--CoA ligase family protein [Actinomycetospora straminea]|uniref:Phenylacetate--CoA ligase family protein n=1 Tax=Actinomycetospora straminea TaxID=663607 RepID=A0ABP9F095_9PSEU|nr:AMP-binding protein [Actinomycetospora straminea]MDD7932883.1 AMP-binding protein [Actinomycetospora straminea]
MPATTAPPSRLTAYRDRVQPAVVAAMPELIARTAWDRDEIVAHQRARLRTLLADAVERSPFHGRRLAGVDPDRVDPRDLSALPTMTKADVVDRFDEVVTDRRLTADLVEGTLARTDTEPRPILDEYVAFASGGSSGRRGVFVLDVPAVVQFVGSLCRNLVARIEQMGGPPPGGLPVAIVAAGSAVHPTGGAIHLAGGPLPFHFLPVPATAPLPHLVDRLNALQAPLLYGYPSVLARLAAEQRAGRLRIRPMTVTSTSETLTPELRAAIREGFGVPIVNTFGSTEGLVGTSAPDDEDVVFAEDGCIVEVVDEHHRPVPPGTPSAAVLVTNLENHLQPLIRYELTDVLTAAPPRRGHLRALVRGRRDEVFRYPGTALHPHVVRSVLVRSPEVAEYQVRQTPTGIAVTVVPAEAGGRVDEDVLAERLADALAAAGLARPEVAVTRGVALDRDPQTGKLCRFVPLADRSRSLDPGT